jgi:probable rRNA maturation factor
LNINIFNSQKNLKISKINVKIIIFEVLKLESKKYDEVAIHFVGTRKISYLHKLYFQQPSTTDCISFPMDSENQPGYRVLGELVVCPQTAIDYTLKHGGDPYTETMLYIVHGLLHLLGYDDLIRKEKLKMRRAEKKHMQNLKKLNLTI